MTTPWRMTVGEIDGETAVVTLRQVGGAWTPHSIVSVLMAGDLITRVVDYGHCPWVLAAASKVVVESTGHVS